MPRSLSLLAALVLLVPVADTLAVQEPSRDAEPIDVAPTDWPWWRGPNRNGVAAADQDPPLKWSAKENVVWHAAVPGRGHGSPIVVGDRVFLPTADLAKETQSVVCYDRNTGKLRWQTDVHHGGLDPKGNAKSSLASSTLACDGKRVFANFLNGGAVYTTALNLDGKPLWQTKVTDYVLHQGYGSSPMPYKSLVLVSADNKGGGAVAGLDRRTGDVVWKHTRPATPNYASPIVVHADGRDQLVMIGCDRVASFDPLTGKPLWDIKGATTECVTSPVTDGKLVYSTGGYPRDHITAIRADGSGKVAWELKTRIYVPSMLQKDGYLYCVPDNGIAMCLKCDTGAIRWKERLEAGFTASPVLVGERVYATNEGGRTYIFRATPDGYTQLGEGQLGGEVLATPAICGGRIYMRVAVRKDGQRQEMLYCLGRVK